jgi:16S rRNA (uracil1498-N3)-methyltransferase
MITLLAEPGSLLPGAAIELPAAERHHLRVRREGGDAAVRLADGHGATAIGTLIANGRVAVTTVTRVARPAPLQLAVAGGDKERWGWLAEKAAELGVTDLVPIETDRTAGVATRLRPEHLDRIRRRAAEAIKQSGSAWAPVVHDPLTLDQLCALESPGHRWLADPDGDPPVFLTRGEGVLAVVGPEGGFTDRERHQVVAAGFAPLRLGPYVLRFETAAIAAATTAGAWRREERYD